MDPRLAGCLVFVLILGAGFAGAWIARRYLVNEIAGPALGAAQAATFGILALLLAFSFSVGLARFDARRAVVVREANAIKTLWYRAALLDHSRALALRTAIVAYTDARLTFDSTENDVTRRSALVHSSDLEAAIWSDVINGTNRGNPSTIC